MRDIEVRDILLLARAEVGEPKDEVRQLYQWRYEYLSTAAKATVGAGASLLVAVLAAALQHKDKDPWLPILLGLAGAVVVLTVGIFMYRGVRRIYREYVTAQELLGVV